MVAEISSMAFQVEKIRTEQLQRQGIINTSSVMLEEKVYKSNSHQKLNKIIKDSLAGYVGSFYLARQLAGRDIKALYRQSFLGFFWAVAPVVMNAVIWIFLNTTGTIKLSNTGIPYPLFVIIGTTFWTLISECLLLPIATVNENRAIITKINFQKEALIMSGLLKLGFNLLIKLALVIVFLFVFKAKLSFSLLFFIPVLIVSIMAFVSIGIIITPLGVLYGDISKAIPIAMQLLMFLTPVVYTTPRMGIMRQIIKWNPLSYIITNLRNTLTGISVENWAFMLCFAVVAVLLTLLGMVIYRVSMPVITERMSA